MLVWHMVGNRVDFHIFYVIANSILKWNLSILVNTLGMVQYTSEYTGDGSVNYWIHWRWFSILVSTLGMVQ